MPADDSSIPLGGLSPADLLRQGAAEDTLLDGPRAPFVPPSLEEMAAIFPQFEILELIGQGGMGAVYRVRQRELDRIVALKILPPSIGEEASFADRFAREAKALAKLNHPGTVTIHEFGQQGRLYFIVMEFVDGVNLRQLLENGRISPREALAIVPQICDALQFAHDLGIVHRDIKPENLLIDRRGRVKVADFGLAKLVGGETDDAGATGFASGSMVTEAGKVMGTPRYMAPEQLESPAEVDHRADIYSLGVVLYQMLTGELPGERLEPPSKKVRLDVRLDEIVLRALEKQPELRYQQASVMKTRVEQASGPPPRTSIRGRAWWSNFLQAAGALLLVIGFMGMLRPSGGRQVTSLYRSNSGDPAAITSALVEVIRDTGPNTSLAGSKDSHTWWISVHHADGQTAHDEFNRVHQKIQERLGDKIGAVTESRTTSASPSPFSRILSGYLLAGVWTGLAGALLAISSPQLSSSTRSGRIALGAFIAALAGSGLVNTFASLEHRFSGVIFGAVALLVSLVCGLMGRHSREGRIALAGFWVVLFLWAVQMPWSIIRFPRAPDAGFRRVPLTASVNPIRETAALELPVEESRSPLLPP
ncbi:serine/threonine protein kinase [Luteolibacter flavescens]|uniref:Serine/threonine protein kinase n=1 Tax=Luteolibacter flavescens TaxID=1859460 RepID=A0ABT3FQ19_9BACT|nr:serine/threonine-protein kinase [Luteolibacter flavescens]MCW1885289.1 serine/threonine protein kinase [Luteolibacter flavescens]